MSGELRARIGDALDVWLDVEREADDRLDELLDEWVQVTRLGMLAARDRLDQLEREHAELENGLAELQLERDGDEAPAA